MLSVNSYQYDTLLQHNPKVIQSEPTVNNGIASNNNK